MKAKRFYIVHFGVQRCLVRHVDHNSEWVAILISAADFGATVDMDCDGFDVYRSRMGDLALKAAEWLSAAIDIRMPQADIDLILKRFVEMLTAAEGEDFARVIGTFIGSNRHKTCTGPLFEEVTA